MLSGGSERSKTTSQLEAAAKLPWYRGVTCKDLKAITPTVLILIAGLLIMIFIIPYAFSSVLSQLEQVMEMERLEALKKEMESWPNRTEIANASEAGSSTLNGETSSLFSESSDTL